MDIKRKESLKNRKLDDVEINDYRKIYMQAAGDLVIEQYLNLDNVVKFENILDKKRISFINNIADNKSIDVVTFNYGLYPIVFKKTYRKTIFVCMLNKEDFYLCGMASPETINKYSDVNLVLSSYLRSKDRVGFYGFDKLSQLPRKKNDFLKTI